MPVDTAPDAVTAAVPALSSGALTARWIGVSALDPCLVIPQI